MAKTPGLEKVACLYFLDNGSPVVVIVDRDNASEGGFGTIAGGEPPIPAFTKMRYLRGVNQDGSGQHYKLPVADFNSVLYQNAPGNTFSNRFGTFNVTSKEGECTVIRAPNL